MARWSDRQKSEKSGNIVDKILTGQRSIINENRDYVKKLIQITLFLAKQGLSFRTHQENEKSLNKGSIKIYVLFSKYLVILIVVLIL